MKPFFPNTRFSLPLEPRKQELGSRVRAIVDASNGRRKHTSLSAAALALVVCFLCVNLVSCAAVRADSGASSDTLSHAVQSEPTPSQPKPTETVPVSEPEPAAPERPRDSILKVLTGEGEAHYHYTILGRTTDEYLDISEIAASIFAEGEPAREYGRITRFAVVDLDGNGVNEAVLEIYVGEWPAEYEILHLYNGEVRYYSLVPKAFAEPKADGTFYWMDAAYRGGWSRIIAFHEDSFELEKDDFLYDDYDFDTGTASYYIDHQPVSKAAYNKVEEEQWNKPDVEWHDFAGADFSEYFD